MAAINTTALFKFYKGVTFSRVFVYRAAGVVVDLTGKTVAFHFHEEGSDTDLLTLASDGDPTDNGSSLVIRDSDNSEFPDLITADEGTVNVIELKITDEDADTFTDDLEGKWWMGLEGGGDIRPIGKGPVKVLEL